MKGTRTSKPFDPKNEVYIETNSHEVNYKTYDGAWNKTSMQKSFIYGAVVVAQLVSFL